MNRTTRSRITRVLATGALACAGLALAAGTAGAAPGTHFLYVSTNSTPDPALGGNQAGCEHAGFTTIGAAVTAAAPGSTVIVCPGTYAEGVTIVKTLNLVGLQATINATGMDNGVHVLASGSTVRGLTVTGATGEGILVQGVPGTPITGVTISGDHVTGNDQGGAPSAVNFGGYAECMPAGGIPGDCGEGIHLMVVADSTVAHNLVDANAGGILLTDEFGPTHGNLILGNNVHDNADDCGITVVSHNPGSFVGGVTQPHAGGVYNNRIIGNRSVNNGIAGQGAGVVLATPFPGGAVYNNTIEGNLLIGNGLAGVTVHSHAPGQDLNGNVVSGNLIGTNNLDGDPDFFPAVDAATTGVLVASVAPLSITVSHNLIAHDQYGIWTMPGVTFVGGTASNTFIGVLTPLFVAS
jgi:hypothetical protein